MVRLEIARSYLAWCRFLVWVLCVGGAFMGWLVAQADRLSSARFTALSGLPGWPEIWGVVLMVLGGLSVLGRFVGGRGTRRVRAAGTRIAGWAMFGMAGWYTCFASSLVLGTAEYGYVAYYTLAGAHLAVAVLLLQTDGMHPGGRQP
jgi:hypothetical protein